ncbi:MAG: hypothetical protein MRZ66_01920 [Clostridiales bacterium]|nr:hypothetical protein [Clostridiales bacterium]
MQIKSVDALGNETTFEYDKNNRLLSTTDPLSHKTGQTYNRAGLVNSKYDGNGNVTSYEYDELGRLVYTKQTVDGAEQIVGYTYDNYGNVLTQTNGEGHTTTFEYNVLNQLTAKIDPNGVGDPTKTESYRYDIQGNLIEKTDRNGNSLSYIYDVHNRLEKIKQGDNVLISQTYDANGNKLSMTDNSGTTTRSYDSLNRVTSKKVPEIGVTTYRYDVTAGISSGNVAERTTDPKGNITIKEYDKNNRLYQVKDSESSEAASYEYYMNGAQKKVTNADGSSANFEYNADGTLSQLTNRTSNGTIIDDYTYTYDAAKNQISKTEISNGQNKGTTSYTYDSVNRLKSVTEPSSKVTQYSYDKAGNRKTETVVENNVTSLTTYNYNDQERLMSTVQTIGGTTKTVSYNYDYNGNIYSKTQGVSSADNGEEAKIEMSLLGIDDTTDCAEIYEYDVFNQFVKTYKGGNVITNVYNGEGHRVSKTSNGVTTNYLYEYDRVILETDGNNNQTARNIYGTNLISRESNNTKYTYHYNGHGDVTSLTDQTGTVAASYDYDPFGDMIGETGNVDNPFRYSGYEFDNETNLYYLKSRFYNSETARFMQEDTYRGDPSDPLSLNLYTYCANNPNTYTDWFGFFGTYNSENPFIVIYTGFDEQRYADSKNGYYRSMDKNSEGIEEYINTEYTYDDMLELLKTSGGNINIVLQVRDLAYGNEDNSIIGYTMCNEYSYIIGLAQKVIEKNSNISMPSFFLGSPEFELGAGDSLEYSELMKSIVDAVVNKVGDDSLLGGIYYGREDPDDIINDTLSYGYMSNMSNYVHSEDGDLIWIPYFTNETEFTNVGYVVNHGKYSVGNNSYDLFDVAILQPGYYYPEVGNDQAEYFPQKLLDIYNSVLYREIIVNNEAVGGKRTTNTKIGVEFEFDIGLSTGRWHSNIDNTGTARGTLPAQKRSNFATYINMFYPLISGQVDGYKRVYGIYAGGPNEMNLRVPKGINERYIGSNFNNVYIAENDMNKNSKFKEERIKELSSYDGNFIYDILNGLVNNNWGYINGESKLLNFINNR